MNVISQDFSINDIFDLDSKNKISECIAQLFEQLTHHKYQIYSQENLQQLFDAPKFDGINMRYGESE